MKTPQSPAPVAGDEPARPASEQPVEAIGAGREVARMREIAISWRHPSLRQIEGPNDLKIYGGTIADDIDRWADMIAVLSPASPARTPMGGEVEALREALEPFAAVADEYDDREDDTFEVWMDAGPVMVRDIREALRLSAFRRARQALAASSPSPAQGGIDYSTLADLHTIKGWLHGLSTHPDLEDVVADGGVTAGMVYQQEAREFAGRIGRILAAPPSVQPVEGK